MLTVRRIDAIQNDSVFEAEEVKYWPVWVYPLEQTEQDFTIGFADHSQFEPGAPGLVIYYKDKRTLYQLGKFFVMNENGSTIATYDLPFRGFRIKDS